MNLNDLKRDHAAPLFKTGDLVHCRVLNAEPIGEAQVGDLVHAYGSPALVTKRERSGIAGVADTFTVEAWVPRPWAETAGRFTPVVPLATKAA
jgi:hypothetical protein